MSNADNIKKPDTISSIEQLHVRDYTDNAYLQLNFHADEALYSGDWMWFGSDLDIEQLQEKLKQSNSEYSFETVNSKFITVKDDKTIYYIMDSDEKTDNGNSKYIFFTPIAAFKKESENSTNAIADFYFPYHLLETSKVQYYRAGSEDAYQSGLKAKLNGDYNDILNFYHSFSRCEVSESSNKIEITQDDNVIVYNFAPTDSSVTIEVK